MEVQENEGISDQTKEELLLITNTFWQALADRDIEKRFLQCADSVTFIGTGLDEKASGKSAYIEVNKKGVEQYPEKFRLSILWERVSAIDDMGWVESETEWAQIINGKEEKTLIRNTIVLKKRDGKWWIVHVHGSVPDFRLSGQNYITNAETIKINRALESEVYQRTKELKQKNRELEIESSLERVRTVAMAMRKPDDMLEVCRMIAEQLEILGIKEIRNVQTAIIDEHGKGTYMNYQYFKTYGEGTIEEVEMAKHPAVEDMIRHMQQSPDAYFTHSFEGEALETWKQYRKDDNQYPDPVLENASALHFYFYSIGQGGLGLSAYTLLSVEEILVFHRFRNVFTLAYQRFRDIEQAMAQAGEAQIELALERVRARTMAMQKSEELKEVIQVVYDQFVHLNIDIEHTGFILDYKSRDDMHIWLADQREVPSEVIIPYFDTAHWNSFNEAKENGKDFFANHLTFDEKNKFYQTLFEKIPGVPEQTKEYYFNCPGLAISTVLLENVGLYIENFSGIPYTDEENGTLMRFGKVFQQTYTRFLDLQKAEAQAREAQIETALEKVRSRSLAMHKSEELQEVVHIVFEKLKELNVDFYTAIIFIFTEGSKDILWWLENKESQQYPRILVPYDDNQYLKAIFETKEKEKDIFTATYAGEEKYKIFHHLLEKTDFKNIPEHQKKFLFESDIATMSVALEKNTGLNITSYSRNSFSGQENEILKRFAKVFDQAYTRFLDLQKAEAQTREAQIEAALERVRSRSMAMHKSEELVDASNVLFKELNGLGIHPVRTGVGTIDSKNETIKVWSSQLIEHNEIKILGEVPRKAHPLFDGYYSAWERKAPYFTYELTGEELKSYYTGMSAILSYPEKKDYDPAESFNVFFFAEGSLNVITNDPLTKDECNLILRFANVFGMIYRRFLDIKQAEYLAEQAALDLVKLKEEKARTEMALAELKATQAQLIQAEKMASLGELTAGIAHEIQNPLNFVNNFSEVNTELIEEMKEELLAGNTEDALALANDIADNEQKINHHGKRADAIVKGMLQHSRSGSGVKEPTDINVLAEEYLRLAYHGLRAKDKSFNATMKTDFDDSIGMISVIPQEIGRVILNLITNAFYVVNEKKKLQPNGFEPTVSVTTKKDDQHIIVTVKDNGNGIPKEAMDKIFQPFFTTKPAGQGTGLGLSLSYDIVKAHGGELKVETKEGEGSVFVIQIPV